MIHDRNAILSRLPHQGGNCLLDTVSHFDAHRIVCTSRAHLLDGNPYRVDGSLPASSTVEFAAQCFALHAALKSGSAAGQGYLASIRSLELQIDSLDQCPDALHIEAEEIFSGNQGLQYSFLLCHQGIEIARGQATVALVREAR